ncbi:flagellar motor switch protein FliN [Simiduia curdlanivorans]|uniref:Flagellar motor switch protein FliN n=1 Tax=Simiduia curdlanivorans TaxID=1492769 RepID=A0ABV8V8M9_9GAMM|nr:flagellar motor switch protein FliN [Simiduia curdlanivorans]MDN3639866.1 flagellar motor switch protein FliN [Simiduia curdlanivorans]
MTDDNTPDNGEEPDQDAMADEWAAAMAEQGDEEDEDEEELPKAAAQTMNLDEFSESPKANHGGQDLDTILDIPVSISMEVGSTSITIRNLLQLNQGSVIELDRLAGEPLDVLVNGTLIAHGEVVVVNEKFGIRMTDVVSPSERIKRLR